MTKRRKKNNKWFMIFLLICALPFIAAWYFSSQILYPFQGKCNPEHFIYCDTPAALGLKFKEIKFQSEPQIEIQGWFIPAKSNQNAIIMVHGITANRRESMRWYKALHQADYNILAIDQRNHGKSSKSMTTMGLKEAKDIVAAVDFLKKEFGIKQTGIFGVSFGSSTSIHAMAIDKRILVGVLEAPFASLRELLEDIAVRDYKLPVFSINLVNFVFKLRSGLDLGDVRPIMQIKRIAPRPVFIIHCPKDELISFSHGKRIYEAAGQPKEFWASPCPGHARAWQGNPQLAEQKVVDFFNKYLVIDRIKNRGVIQ